MRYQNVMIENNKSIRAMKPFYSTALNVLRNLISLVT